MLFNSFSFLFFYLPLVLGGYFLLGRWSARLAMTWLALASLAFYAYWDVRYLPLLLASVTCNYAGARRLAAASTAPARKRWLIALLAANLALLAYYKYANFFVDNVSRIGFHGLDAVAPALLPSVLPIGISFFTFTQIAFLVDCYRGHVREYRFIHYVLFVSYFPHLIAGPVLHHKEMMPQFEQAGNTRPHALNFAVGGSIFVLGLAKKVLLADPLSVLAGPVFAAGSHPQLIEAWIGALAYTFQLYFDFSGYSDMAIGLSRLFGVRLPLNFNSPYKAANIAEFWRRWHMTLSRFLREYLYVPLGGNRHGAAMRYRNLMLTMLLGGLWHGAGWTFVVWGGLHGLYLVLHQAWLGWLGWLDLRAHRRPAALQAGRPPLRLWGRALTFLAVLLAWVVFRSPDLAAAGDILSAMVGAHGVALPSGLAAHADSLRWLTSLGWNISFAGIRWIDFSGVGVPVLLLAMALAFIAPNTQEWFGHYEPCLERPRTLAWGWSPGKLWSVAFSLLLLGCVFSMNQVSEFLYFQF